MIITIISLLFVIGGICLLVFKKNKSDKLTVTCLTIIAVGIIALVYLIIPINSSVYSQKYTDKIEEIQKYEEKISQSDSIDIYDILHYQKLVVNYNNDVGDYKIMKKYKAFVSLRTLNKFESEPEYYIGLQK